MSAVNKYKYGQISQIMHIAPGSSADYNACKKSSIAMAVEISKARPSSSTTGEEMAQENFESTLRFIEAQN